VAFGGCPFEKKAVMLTTASRSWHGKNDSRAYR